MKAITSLANLTLNRRSSPLNYDSKTTGCPLNGNKLIGLYPNLPVVGPQVTFKHGFFGCFDNFGICLFSFCCPCIQFGYNAEVLGEDCLIYGLFYLLTIPCAFVLGSIQRKKLREYRGILGDFGMDVVLWTFCGPCALCQESQELEEPPRLTMARN